MIDAKALYELGYRDLVSIIPPGARLVAGSKLKGESIGKAPGREYPGGWGGYDWRSAGPVDLRAIESWGQAGVGVRTDRYPAVDIDCTDPVLVGVVRKLALEFLGAAPERVGRAPKTLLLYRTDEPFGRLRLWIGEHLVEILGDGQQFVAAGIHPVTGKPYEWPAGLRAAEDLTPITRGQAAAFLEALEADAEMLGYECRWEGTGAASLDRTKIDQEALTGDYGRIEAALRLIPNDEEHFPGRDDYLRMGYAVKAALGDAGYDLFLEWALQWEANTVESVESDWQRMKPPFEIGASYIYETARGFGYNDAGDEFTADPDAKEPEQYKQTGLTRFSDAYAARQLARVHGDKIRYCPEREAWLSWDGKKWADKNGGLTARNLSSQICNGLALEALADISQPSKAESMAMRLASTATTNAVVKYCEFNPLVHVNIDQLDHNPHLINTPGGIIDLRTALMLPHDPKEYMTRMAAVTPQAGTPSRWLRFLDEATGGDKQLQLYLQRLCGYALTGLKTEHNLAFIYGTGGNGKSVFLNTVYSILGEYSTQATMDTFTSSKSDRHPTDLAGLAGARLVTANETQADKAWDEQRVKALTSSDPMKARFMREDFFTFEPTFKLVMAGNHKPQIRNLDDAMKRRIHLIPFTIKPKAPDSELPEKLKLEFPQIMAWMVDGARMWMEQGLNPPPSVIEATNEYFEDEDPVGQWIKARIRFEPDGFATTTDLFRSWQEWAGENGEEDRRTAKKLSMLLRDREGWHYKRTAVARGFEGISIIPAPEFTL